MSSYCSAVRSISLSATDSFIDYRLLIIIIGLLGINLFLECIHTKVLPCLAVYKHLGAETCQALSMRTVQIFLGPIVAISGFGFLFFEAFTGCNASEIYLFYIGGISFVVADLHEFVARWPLKAPLLSHHIATFILALAHTDFKILPATTDGTFHWATTLFFANTGLVWTIDFFHFVFRTSKNLELIKTVRKAYLWLGSIRVANSFLLLMASMNAAKAGVWFGFVVYLFMTGAYAYNAYECLAFVYRFDCERYYNTHQGKWLGENKDEATQLSRNRLERTASLVSRSLRRFSIPLVDDDEIPSPMPGLGGDASVFLDLSPDDSDSNGSHANELDPELGNDATP